MILQEDKYFALRYKNFCTDHIKMIMKGWLVSSFNYINEDDREAIRGVLQNKDDENTVAFVDFSQLDQEYGKDYDFAGCGDDVLIDYFHAILFSYLYTSKGTYSPLMVWSYWEEKLGIKLTPTIAELMFNYVCYAVANNNNFNFTALLESSRRGKRRREKENKEESQELNSEIFSQPKEESQAIGDIEYYLMTDTAKALTEKIKIEDDFDFSKLSAMPQ